MGTFLGWVKQCIQAWIFSLYTVQKYINQQIFMYDRKQVEKQWKDLRILS